MIGLNLLSVIALQLTAIRLVSEARVIPRDVPFTSSLFSNPPSTARPKARYWLKDAYGFNPAVARYDLTTLKATGFGGAEIVDYANYVHGKVVEDLSLYSLGSANWAKMFETYVQTAVDLSMHLDFALGAASSGAAVSSFHPATDPGLLTGVGYGSQGVAAGTHFDGSVPGLDSSFGRYTQGKFVAASYGKVSSGGSSGHTLVYSSMVELTDMVTCSGSHCTVSFTTPSDGGSYVLISFWTIGASFQEVPGGSTQSASLPASSGLYYVDHFSAAGPNASAAFFQNDVFTALTTQLLPQLPVPSYAWQDSLEFGGVQYYWGSDMAARWKAVRPYGPGIGLPGVFSGRWSYDEAGVDGKILNDYKYVLTDGYRAYTQASTEWAHTLGIQYSQQPYGYTAPSMDIAGVSATGDAPETESLDFKASIDGIRHMTGGVHTPTSGGIFSEELGAIAKAQYQTTWPIIMTKILPGIAAGVNMMLLHGYPYSGSYPETTWPGFTAFDAYYGNAWGPRNPDWNYSKPAVDFIARNFLICQTGKAKVDLALWSWNAGDGSGVSRASIVNAGYSYEYLSTMTLEHANNIVQDGKLNPNNAAYKAFLFPGITSIDTNGLAKILSFAKQGFPMVFYESKPSSSTNLVTNGDSLVQSTMTELLALNNVKYVASEAAAVAALKGLGVNPATSFSQATAVYPVHHATNDTDFIWLYNSNAQDISMNIEFAFTGTPYWLDAWTGAVTPVPVYTQDNGSTTILVTIPAGGTTIYAFGKGIFSDVLVPPAYITSTDVSYPTVVNGVIKLRETQSATRSVKYSDGTSKSLSFNVPSPITITSWSLSIMSFNPPSDPTDTDPEYFAVYETTKWNINKLVAWSSIDSSLASVSGVGTYTSSFTNSGTAAGAFLTLTGAIFDTVEVSINGVKTAPLNIFDPFIDISSYLRSGENDIVIVTASTLINKVSSLGSQLESTGDSDGSYSSAHKQAYGLVGDVIINFYQV